jgi:urease subunit alpha
VRGSRDPHDNERVLRHLAKVTINPALAHGLAGHVGALTPGRLADAVLWDPALVGVRPALVLKAGMAAWGASGDGNAATMTCEPVRVGPQIGALGGAPARISLAFLAGSAMDADLPTARERARVQGCRDLGAADMVRNTRTGEVRVDPRTLAVSFEGEALEAPPVEDLAFSGTFLLG